MYLDGQNGFLASFATRVPHLQQQCQSTRACHENMWHDAHMSPAEFAICKMHVSVAATVHVGQP